MKKMIFAIISVLCIAALVTSGGLPVSANSVSQSIPQSINGLRVIFIQTPANTPYLNAGERIITLLDNSASSMESANKFSSNVESIKSLLKPGDLIEVWGGEDASEAQYDANHAATIETWKKNGSIQLYNPTITSVNQETAASTATTYAGYASIQDTDIGNNTNVWGISVQMYGITPNPSQNGTGSAFLVNATTNPSQSPPNYYPSWFYQAGQFYYHDGTCANVYSYKGDNPPNQARQFTLKVTQGHLYNYEVRNLGGPSSIFWQMEATDLTTGSYNYFLDPYGHGTYLVNDKNTSFWFENQNPNPGWWSGFPPYVWAYSAKEFRSYQWVNWTSDDPQLWVGGQGPYPAYNVIYNHLTNNQSAYWWLQGVPLQQ
jgi:hypothetical protein